MFICSVFELLGETNKNEKTVGKVEKVKKWKNMKNMKIMKKGVTYFMNNDDCQTRKA